jgi:tRNA nucleotidyltransferase/poly(A) polymerase
MLKTRIEIKEEILKEIGKLADKHQVEALIVGGYVRDLFLERTRNDFDITIIGDPIEFARIIGSFLNKKVVEFKRFRTAHIDCGDYELEFVGTRKETYIPGSRHPITEEGTLEDDIKRRDFTINSMAAYLNENRLGELVDMYNGLRDLEEKVLRTPLDPDITFKDDPLRMLRAARFWSQLKDFKLDIYPII